MPRDLFMRSVPGRMSRHHMRLLTRKLILDLPQDQGKHYSGLAHTRIHKKYVIRFFFFSLMQPAPFEFTNDRLRLIPEAGLREEMIQSRPLLQTALSSSPHNTAIFHNWHICSGTEMSDLPFVQLLFFESCSVLSLIILIFIYILNI